MIHTLSDGRALSYAEYGDTKGVPVFFFHGMPGSRLFRPPDEITQRSGVRLICVERPGYGRSTYQPHRRIVDWVLDIKSLADALKLDHFAVSGHSGGCPYSLACAYAFPERVTAASVVSGAGPVDAPNITEGIMPLHRFGLIYGRFIPWSIWQFTIRQLFRQVAADPSKAIDRDRDIRPQGDNEILDQPDVREMCIQSDMEAYCQGLMAFTQESYLLTRPWGFSLKEIKVPVYLWQGTVDNSTTMGMARFMASEIPQCKTTFCEGEAHMLLIPHWEEILTELIQNPIAA